MQKTAEAINQLLAFGAFDEFTLGSVNPLLFFGRWWGMPHAAESASLQLLYPAKRRPAYNGSINSEIIAEF